MNKPTLSEVPYNERILVNCEDLQAMLSCGRKTATTIGKNANAECRVGRRVLWNVRKITNYLEQQNA